MIDFYPAFLRPIPHRSNDARAPATFHSVRLILSAGLVLLYLLYRPLGSDARLFAAPADSAALESISTQVEEEIYTLYLPNLYHNYWHITAPFAPYPEDGVTDISLNTFLRWSGDLTTLPDGERPFQYEVYLAEGDAPSTEPLAVVAANALDTQTLAPDAQYTWQVVAIDAQGDRYAGPEWTFQTLAVPDTLTDVVSSTVNLAAMVTIPAGEFVMGCDRNNPHDESKAPCVDGTGIASEPLHRVFLDAFEIDVYEVTNHEYAGCVDAGACEPPRKESSMTRDAYYRTDEYALYPVIYVSWQNAQDYCAWEDKRLPTEAEWEKAARGPIDTRAWPWGNEPFACDRMLYARDVICGWDYDSVRVGLFPNGMSPYGALDMAGNVAEWVSDKFDQTYYSWTPYANPQGSDVSRVFSGLERTSDEWGWPTHVLRGGDFLGRFYYHSVYYRYWGHWGEQPHTDDIPLFRNKRTGFRCARSLDDDLR